MDALSDFPIFKVRTGPTAVAGATAAVGATVVLGATAVAGESAVAGATGITVPDASDALPVPLAFVAVTLNM